jgi:hypothetical protein
MRDEWLTQQIQLCETHVREERQRLHEAKQRSAREALIVLSLPELLGEVDDDQQDEAPGPAIH